MKKFKYLSSFETLKTILSLICNYKLKFIHLCILYIQTIQLGKGYRFDNNRASRFADVSGSF